QKKKGALLNTSIYRLDVSLVPSRPRTAPAPASSHGMSSVIVSFTYPGTIEGFVRRAMMAWAAWSAAGMTRAFVFGVFRVMAESGAGSLDDLVGSQQNRLRDHQAERPGGLKVDHQLEGRRLLDRQIGGLGTLEDLSHVLADQAK